MPRVKQFDEQQALEKAMALFWKQGYYATSIQNLVDHLGINRASLYDTFGGKRQLFERAFQHYRTVNRDQIIAFLDARPSVKEGIRQLFLRALRQTLADAEKKGCFVVNCTTELLPNEAEMLPALLANKTEFIDLFREYLQRGVDRGEIAPEKDLTAIATFLFTLYNGLQVVAKVSERETELAGAIATGLSVFD